MQQNFYEFDEKIKLASEVAEKSCREAFAKIIEEMNEEQYNKFSNNREEYWIIYYDALKTGYNETSGGDGGFNQKAVEKTRRLTTDEVKHIRHLYNDCELCFDEAFQLYQNRISRRGFQAIWLGQNYKTINPEVFSEENKKKRAILERQRTGAMRKAKK